MRCKNCKISFKKRTIDPRDKNKFCSSKCALSAVRTRKHQVLAGKKAGLLNIRKYRGTGTKTYVKENGRHQHRVVMERVIGRKLKRGEIVHHIDRDKKNNKPSNLMLLKSQSEHFKLHRLEDKNI